MTLPSPAREHEPIRSGLVRAVAAMRGEPAAEFHTCAAAEAAGASSHQYIRAFRRLTGVSPLRFRAAWRISRAKALILDTDRSITEIGLEVGYESIGTFVRTFTAMVGISPTRLRTLAQQRPDGDLAGLPEADIYDRPNDDDATHIQITFPNLPPEAPLVVAGLFREAIPAGWPIDGAMGMLPQHMDLRWPSGTGRLALLAAAIAPAGTGSIWAPAIKGLWVAAQPIIGRRLREGGQVGLRFRRARETDPPLLVPLPLLASAQARRNDGAPRGDMATARLLAERI